MIAAAVGLAGAPPLEPSRALPDGERRSSGALRVAWHGEVDVAERDELLVLVDGVTPGGTAEALRRGWRDTGTRALIGMRGTFAVLVWDGRLGRAWAAGDPAAARPWFLRPAPDHVAFVTDLPLLRAMLPTSPEPDWRMLASWVAPRHHRGHETPLRGVERVGAARVVEVGDGTWRRSRWWRASYAPPTPLDRSGTVAELRRTLDDAVAARLDDAAPTGIVLSGGIDSSVVAASAARLGADVRTYSAVFPRWRGADETSRIRATVGALGVPNRRFSPEPQGALGLAARMLLASGLPLGGPGALVERPLLEAAAADGVVRLLDGQGGDELLMASPYLLADRLRRLDVLGVRQLLRRMPARGRRPGLREVGTALREQALLPLAPAAARGWVVRGRNRGTFDHLTEQARRWMTDEEDPYVWLRHDGGVPRWWSYLEHLLGDGREGTGLSDYAWYRGADLGLRSTLPLFDAELVRLVQRLPPEHAWAPRNRPTARATAADVLPPEIMGQRRKANIGGFYLDVLKGPDGEHVRRLIADPEARVRELIMDDALARMLGRRPSLRDPGSLEWATALWRLATAELWLRWAEDATLVERELERLPPVASTEPR